MDDLKQAIQDAVENNHGIVEFQDTQIDIDDARFLVETAEKQLKNPDQPVKVEGNQDDESRKVLIIKENAE